MPRHLYRLLDGQDIGEYYREPGWADPEARSRLLEDTILPQDLTIAEEHEACRALKGVMLRQEIYGLDGTEKEPHPYTVTEQNFTIRMLQPQGSNKHAVLFTHAREALGYHYERNPHDPRGLHSIALEVDKYGNELKSVAIAYGRKQSPLAEQSDRDKQTKKLIIYTDTRVTNAIDDVGQLDDYRSPAPLVVSSNTSVPFIATMTLVLYCRWANSNLWLYPVKATDWPSHPACCRRFIKDRSTQDPKKICCLIQRKCWVNKATIRAVILIWITTAIGGFLPSASFIARMPTRRYLQLLRPQNW